MLFPRAMQNDGDALSTSGTRTRIKPVREFHFLFCPIFITQFIMSCIHRNLFQHRFSLWLRLSIWFMFSLTFFDCPLNLCTHRIIMRLESPNHQKRRALYPSNYAFVSFTYKNVFELKQLFKFPSKFTSHVFNKFIICLCQKQNNKNNM